jgi:hypothetical protein
MVQLQNFLKNFQLELCGLVVRIDLQGPLEFVLSLLVVSHSPHDKPPHDPIVGVLRLDHYCFFDFFNGLGGLSIFEECKCPVAIAAMVSIGVVEFGLVADLDGFSVVLVHVVDEGQIVVGVLVVGVDLDADLQVLIRHRVLFLFEVGQTQVVLQLGIFGVQLTGLLEGFDGLVVELHLVESHSKVEETSGGFTLEQIKLVAREVFQLLPVF